MRIMPDYFREMAERMMALVPHAGDPAGKSYLASVAATYRELAQEADRTYVPFEPTRVYAPSLYVDVVERVSSC